MKRDPPGAEEVAVEFRSPTRHTVPGGSAGRAAAGFPPGDAWASPRRKTIQAPRPRTAVLLAASLASPAFALSTFTAGTAANQSIDGFGTAVYVVEDGIDGEDWYDYGKFADVLVNDFNADFLRVELSHQAFAIRTGDSRLDLDYTTPSTLQVGVADAPDLAQTLAGNVAMFDFQALRARVSGRAATAVTTAAQTRGRGINVIASLWTPPHYLKGPGVDQQGNATLGGPFLNNPGNVDSAQGTIRNDEATYAQFGEYVAAYVTGFEQAWDVELAALSIQNEPDLFATFNSQQLTNPERYVKALTAVDDAFEKYGIDTKLVGPELVGVGSQVIGTFPNSDRQINNNDNSLLLQAELYETLQENPETADLLDVYAVHGVDGRELIESTTLVETITFTNAEGEEVSFDRDNANFAVDFEERWTQLRDGFSFNPSVTDPDAVDQNNFAGIGRDTTLWQTETSGDLHLWVPTLDEIEEDRQLRDQQPAHASGALGQAVSMHHALAEGDASAYLFWQLTYDTQQEREQPDRIDENFVLLKVGDDQVYDLEQKKYAAAKHFSRFARAGMDRLDLTLDAGDDVAREDGDLYLGDLLGSLYHDADTGDFSLVLINTFEAEREVSIDLTALGDSLAGIEALAGVVTDADRTWSELDAVEIDNGILTFLLGGQSLVSLSSNATFVPEPASATLALSAAGLLLRRRR